MSKLKVSPRQKDVFLVVLISLVSIYSFLVAWSETSFSDDITVMPLRVIQRAERMTDEQEKLRLYDSLKTAINSYLVKKPGNIYLNYFDSNKCGFIVNISLCPVFPDTQHR